MHTFFCHAYVFPLLLLNFPPSHTHRSIDWRAHLHPTAHKGGPDGQGRTSQDLLQAFLDHPAVLMFLVTGHHNISHPKLVSMPLGPTNAASCTRVAQDMMKENRVHGSDTYRKRSLLLTAGSNFRFRPAIRECVRSNMGDDLLINREMLSLDKYLLKVLNEKSIVATTSSMLISTYQLYCRQYVYNMSTICVIYIVNHVVALTTAYPPAKLFVHVFSQYVLGG